jgi:hypothetical protein
MANEYALGQLVRCTGTYTDAEGVAVDPTAVFFEVEDPSGNTTSLEYPGDAALHKSGTGIYYVDVDADECGWWYYRHYATGTGQAADEASFRVKESRFD